MRIIELHGLKESRNIKRIELKLLLDHMSKLVEDKMATSNVRTMTVYDLNILEDCINEEARLKYEMILNEQALNKLDIDIERETTLLRIKHKPII